MPCRGSERVNCSEGLLIWLSPLLSQAAGSRLCYGSRTHPPLLEAVAQIAQLTGDVARDLPPATLNAVRHAFEASPHAADLLRQLAGEDIGLAASSRVFGEELPAGLALAESTA